MPSAISPRPRLEGLDLARYLAFVGMVIVNFRIAMGAEGGTGLVAACLSAIEGRAAATFVVLAGIGLGLAGASVASQTLRVTLRRAAFLLVIGLLNMLIFEADILHYYAFYFLFGTLFLHLGGTGLAWSVLGLNLAFVGMILTLDYDAGWDWQTYTYSGFWTPDGFVRNLFFNGWHPVVPWLSFLLFGLILSRMPLAQARTQLRLVGFGCLAVLLAEGISLSLTPALAALDPDLAVLATTKPIPPMPLYMIAGMGTASVVTGLCLRAGPALARLGILAVVTPAGRQTLTLYIAHIVIGMGVLEAMGLLGGQTETTAFRAALWFCAAATAYAWLWARVFRRGPVEALMRRTAG